MSVSKNNYSNILLLIILTIYTFFYLYISSQIPIDGDGALHAATVKVMAEKGSLIDFHPYTITDGEELLPIFYPKLFYTLSTILTVFDFKIATTFMVPFFGVLIGLFTYLLCRQIFTDRVSPFVGLIIALSSAGLILNSVSMFRMETTVVLLALAAFYSLLRYMGTKNSSWLIVSIITFAAALSTKQQAYLYIPFIFLAIYLRLKSNLLEKTAIFMAYMAGSFLLASPMLINQFQKTGTFFYPGVPLVGKIESQIAKVFNIRLYETGEGWIKYGVGSDRITSLKSEYSRISSHITFLNPLDGAGPSSLQNFLNVILAIGTITLAASGGIFLIIFLILQQVVLYIQPLERYFLMNQILAVIIITSGYKHIIKFIGKHKTTSLALTGFIIFVFSTYSFSFMKRNLAIPNYEWGQYAPEKIPAAVESSDWIRENTGKDTVLITPRTHIFSYYSERKSLWINQIGGTDIYEAFLHNDIEKIHEIAKRYQDSYIVIPVLWVVEEEADGKWIPFIEQKTVSMIDADKKLFEKVFKNSYVTIYKVI